MEKIVMAKKTKMLKTLNIFMFLIYAAECQQNNG